MGIWCFVLLVALSLSGPSAWADAGKARADGLCSKAERAEWDAKEADWKSERRQQFLKGKGGVAFRNDTSSTGGDTGAIRQSVKARIAKVRALLPQLRQAAAAAAEDSGVAPGFSQYFSRMESDLRWMLQAADACLDPSRFCSVPPISCPPMPALPVFHFAGPSARLARNMQKSYAESANQFRQACRNLSAGIVGDVERLKRESLPAGPMIGFSGVAPPQPFVDTDLYLRRAENLRREAALSRQEADRVSGVRGYCSARSHGRVDAETSHAVVEGGKVAERPRKPEADFPLDAKVIDLKEEWEKKWDKEMALNAPNGPLPKLTGGEEKSTPARSTQLPDQYSTTNPTDVAVAKPAKPVAEPVDGTAPVDANPIADTPAIKDPAVALTGSDEQVETVAQRDSDAKAPVDGKPGSVPKVAKTSPDRTAPVAGVPVLKDPAVVLTDTDEQMRAAAQGAFDSTGPLLGKPW